MRKVEQIMGMPISIDIPGGQPEVFEKAFERFREIDERFSTFKPASEVGHYKCGEIKRLSPELKKVIEACRKAEAETDGYFSAWASGEFDPSGYVKGWAISEAAKLIEENGFEAFCIGAGGDVLARSNSGKKWTVGIQDPFDKKGILGVVTGGNFAIATSGSYERGSHIYNPKTGKPADKLVSFSVVGGDIIKADILATAGFAAGESGINLVSNQRGYEALAIDKSGQKSTTNNMKRLLTQVP